VEMAKGRPGEDKPQIAQMTQIRRRVSQDGSKRRSFLAESRNLSTTVNCNWGMTAGSDAPHSGVACWFDGGREGDILPMT